MRSAAGAFLLRKGQVLLARRAPHRDLHPGEWDVPGGHCRPDEQPWRAVARELREELGITPRSIHWLADLDEPDVGRYGPACYHLFLVTSWAGGEPSARGTEHTELRWLSLRQAMEMELAHPGYRDLLARLEAGDPGSAGADADDDRWEWHIVTRKPRRCPRCGSARVAPLLYGYPIFNENLEAALEAGEIALGGCCVSECDAHWQCVDCEQDIYRYRDVYPPERDRRGERDREPEADGSGER